MLKNTVGRYGLRILNGRSGFLRQLYGSNPASSSDGGDKDDEAKRVREAAEYVVQKMIAEKPDWIPESNYDENPDYSKYTKRLSSSQKKGRGGGMSAGSIDRMVEDLIQKTFDEEQMRNLPGMGKPLKDRGYNPHIDFMEQKLNEILIKNGASPDWIMIGKEVREARALYRLKLRRLCRDFKDSIANEEWESDGLRLNFEYRLGKLEEELDQINADIERFNFVVPFLSKQMFPINSEKEYSNARKAVLEE